MTDKEFIEMTRLLDSLIKGADTLRVVFQTKEVEDKDSAIRTGGIFTTRVVATDKAKEHPDFKIRYSLLPDQEIKKLVDLIKGCDDWTSDKFKASEIYRMMRGFVSVTSGMPVGISGLFKDVRSLCRRPMEIIPEKYPNLYPEIIRAIKKSKYYKTAIDDGRITPPLTWTKTLTDLAFWIDKNIFEKKPAIYKVMGGRRNWTQFDCVFRIAGEPVTAKQLRKAITG